jgi:protein-tyrosine phosphatase
MIDIHTHLLPGVDDGSRSIEASLPILRQFGAGGVQTVVCTPHLDASRAARAPYEKHAAILEELRAAAPAVPELLLGWEIMLDVPGADLTSPQLGLGGSKAILVEFPRSMLPPNAAEELFRLRTSGVVPIVAHPERYIGCTPDMVEQWRRVGAVIQMDIAGVVGSRRGQELGPRLLERGLVDIFASDTHVDSRSLVPAREWVLEVATSEHAELLTRVNAERVLAGQEMIPVPPLTIRTGILARLKSMLLGRS